MSDHHFPNIKKICALGAGTMGIGTAVDYAKEGYQVALYVRADSTLSEFENEAKRHKAVEGIDIVLKDMAAHHLIDAESIHGIKTRIKITGDLHEAASDADFVMESIKEETADKQDIFLRLDKICPPHTIFATNTSALNPTEIASVLPAERQKKFIVLHGFNPPHLMPLVEVAPGQATDPATINTAMYLLESIGKKPVRLHKATPGFIGNYIQSAIIWAALELHIVYGHDAAEIDSQFREKLGQYYEVLGPLEIAGYENGELSDIQAKTLLAVMAEKKPDTSIAAWIRNAALRAALEIVANGTANARDVEHAFVHSLGRRYRETGPLESADLGGLDIFESIFRTLGYLKEQTSISMRLGQLVASKQTGTKSASKKGVYDWTPEKIAETGARRKAKLVELLRQDEAKHPMAGHNMRPELIRRAALS